MSALYPLFAYGSMTASRRLKGRGVNPVRTQVATLAGFELRFLRPGIFGPLLGGMATVERSGSGRIHGMLHWLDSKGQKLLDMLELVPLGIYRQISVVVTTDDGLEHEAVCYQLRNAKGDGVPRFGYLCAIVAGLREAGFSAQWLDEVLTSAERAALCRVAPPDDSTGGRARSTDVSCRALTPQNLPPPQSEVLPQTGERPLQLRKSSLLYLCAVPGILWNAVLERVSPLSLRRLNPGFPGGGWLQTSKFARMRPLLGAAGVAPTIRVVPTDGDVLERVSDLLSRGVCLPAVAKPDCGLMSNGVLLVRTAAELQALLTTLSTPFLIQPYIAAPHEFAALYCRARGATAGCILDLAERRLPSVIGDGVSTVAELIRARPDLAALAPTLLDSGWDGLAARPERGERVQVKIAASSATGATFVARPDLITDALRGFFDDVARPCRGFLWGKFDFKANSEADVARGRDLTVLELNGSASEVTSLFDSRVPFAEAVRIVHRQYRMMMLLAACNGNETLALYDLLRAHRNGRIRQALVHETVRSYRSAVALGGHL